MKNLAMPGWRLVPLRLVVLALTVWWASACALLPTPQPAPASAAAPAVATQPPVTLQIQAPSALRALLEKHLDLARLQQLQSEEAISAVELRRLISAAPAQARELLQTEGYFDAQVQVQREGSVTQAITKANPITVQIKVEPGPATKVTSLQVVVQGALAEQAKAGQPAALALEKALPEATDLKLGSVFRNPDWSSAKQQWLTRLRAAGYAGASIVHAQADVDPDTQSASLQVTLASGPAFLAGPVVISGLQHQDEATVRHLAGFDTGEPLTETHLRDYQDRLQKSRLFQTVSVSFDPVDALAAATPVRVRVTEMPLQQATTGVGISANTGPRVTLEHTHRRPWDQPLIAYNKLEWGAKTQLWNGDLQTHPGAGGYRSLLGAQLQRDVSNTDIVLSQRLRAGRTQDTSQYERLYFVELLRSRQESLTGTTPADIHIATALSGNYHWVWRDLDSQLLPTKGITLALQGGAGQATSNNGHSGPFARLYGRLTGYLPLGSQWYGQARLEAGQIVKKSDVLVPDGLGFRAGGDDSVRGYAYRTLAPVDATGTTVSGISLVTSSVELARPISADMPSIWGAVFVDAGRAFDHWSGMKPALGYGVGVRWRGPIGPLRVDLARAQELKKWRLHLSVGIAF
jgi:translocation and assembly module TamA